MESAIHKIDATIEALPNLRFFSISPALLCFSPLLKPQLNRYVYQCGLKKMTLDLGRCVAVMWLSSDWFEMATV